VSPTPLPVGRPLRVGIVGLGKVYELTVRGYRDNPDVEVVALCDRDPTRLAERGPEWPQAQRFERLEDLVALDLDLVEVIVPTPAHADVVCQVLEAGHHVTLQKPMANTLEEADRMLASAASTGATLRVMENYVFYEPLRRMKDLVEAGDIGEVAGFHMKMVGTGLGGWDVPWQTWLWQFEQAKQERGILTFDDGWHKFAVASWLFGPVEEVMGWFGSTVLGGDFAMDAPATIAWTHANGVRGVLDITFAPQTLMPSRYYSNDERFEVTGTHGFARVNHCTATGLRLPPLEVYRDGELRQFHDLDDDWGSSFRDSTRHAVQVLKTGEGDLLFSGAQARDILAFALTAQESSRQGRRLRLQGADA